MTWLHARQFAPIDLDVHAALFRLAWIACGAIKKNGSRDMKTLITLDYELFFGGRPGTVKRCLIDPTDALRAQAKRLGCRMIFFVDAGMLVRMKSEANRHPSVASDFDEVRRQLERLVAEGHDIQLHIHPHWEDSHWSDGGWVMNTRRYRLHQFSDNEIRRIIKEYREVLAEAAGFNDICAYRAGGWALQPFEQIAAPLGDNGIVIDSSVMPGQHLEDEVLRFDFRAAPMKGAWRFSTDPNLACAKGNFLEVPISSTLAPALTKISSAISKRLGPAKHSIFGDGNSINSTSPGRSMSRFLRLFSAEPVAATLDGYKSVLLGGAYNEHVRRESSTFVVIGHPKTLTPFAVEQFSEFLKSCAPQTATFPQIRDSFMTI